MLDEGDHTAGCIGYAGQRGYERASEATSAGPAVGAVTGSTNGKTLVFLIGPPAVGKMTVGRALERLTGMPMLHNHMTIEPVLPFFSFGTPAFGRLVGEFRRRILEEVAASDLPGMSFTFVWAFDEPSDARFVEEMTAIFAARGGRTVFVELEADLETRLARNALPDRIEAKASKRDVERSRASLLSLEEQHRMNSVGAFPYSDHVRLDTTELSPEQAARRIVETFGLPSAPGTT